MSKNVWSQTKSVGDYSPTVYHSYDLDQHWFEKNGGGIGNGVNPSLHFDDDGYNAYGYDKDNYDRAGNCVHEYVESYDGDFDCYHLFEIMTSEWSDVELLVLREKRLEAEKFPEFLAMQKRMNELEEIVKQSQEEMAVLQKTSFEKFKVYA